MARAIDKRIMFDLIIEAKKTDPETGPFSEWLAEYLVDHLPTIIQQNGPLTQADLDVMDYDKVWIDYGDDGEWALVVSGRIYALAVLEGAGFGDILRDEVGGETMDRPSGNYTVYRCPNCGGTGVITVVVTNADRIRAMSDEELAWELMTWRLDAVARNHGVEGVYPDTQKEILKWLHQPGKGGHMMDIEKLIEQLHIAGAGNPGNIFDEAADALSTLQLENEKLRAELEQVKAERGALIEDFVDYVTGGVPNPAIFCKNRCSKCVDMRGWCTGKNCNGFYPSGASGQKED